MDVIERFMSHVDKMDNGCWIWNKSAGSSGYGNFWNGTDTVTAHRYSYEIFVAKIPDGRDNQVLHACNNKLCVNPEHLVLGTSFANYLHAKECGLIPGKGQRFGRKPTVGRELAKGVIYETARHKFRASIRVMDKRYQARFVLYEDAVAWRLAMEQKYWVQEAKTHKG